MYTYVTFVGAKFGTWLRASRTWDTREEVTAAIHGQSKAEERAWATPLIRRLKKL